MSKDSAIQAESPGATAGRSDNNSAFTWSVCTSVCDRAELAAPAAIAATSPANTGSHLILRLPIPANRLQRRSRRLASARRLLFNLSYVLRTAVATTSGGPYAPADTVREPIII